MAGIELTDDRVETCFAVVEARRQLKKEAAHAVAQNIRDETKILDERLRIFELLHMRNEFTNLDRVDEFAITRLPFPCPDVCNGRPRVK